MAGIRVPPPNPDAQAAEPDRGRGLTMLFEYTENNTVIHRLDPRTKIIWLGVVMVLAILIRDPGLLLLLFALTLLPCILTRIPRRSLLPLTGFYLIVALGATASQAFFYQSSSGVPLTLICIVPPSVPLIGTLTGGIFASYEGAVYGFIQAFRILSVINASAALVISTPLSRIIIGLREMGMPALFAFMLSTAVRFVPTLMEEYETILTSLRSRNLISPWHPLHMVELSFSPLIINSIRRCNQLALAAESRAFDTGRERTAYTQIAFAGRDIAAFFLTGIAVLVLGALSLRSAGVLVL